LEVEDAPVQTYTQVELEVNIGDHHDAAVIFCIL
jgi:hypothetical protein